MDIVKKDRNVRTNRYTKKKHYCGNNHEKYSNGQQWRDKIKKIGRNIFKKSQYKHIELSSMYDKCWFW